MLRDGNSFLVNDPIITLLEQCSNKFAANWGSKSGKKWKLRRARKVFVQTINVWSVQLHSPTYTHTYNIYIYIYINYKVIDVLSS
jgi:hypothetical protein